MVTYQLLLGALGLLCGIGVAAGVFALVASLGMVPRMAGKTSVAAYVPALAEVLNVFPVLFRRMGIKTGLEILITFFAFGKVAGGLVYFFCVAG